MRWLLCFGCLILAGVTHAAVIRVQAKESESDQRQHYPIRLLEQVLQKTAKPGKTDEIQRLNIPMSAVRLAIELEHGRLVDVIWLPTSNDLENRLLPIRLPIIKDILGYRLLFLNKAKTTSKIRIDTLADLRRYSIGQGHDWGDVRILEHNGIKVVKSPTYEGLFQMLLAGRFDFFSRGITEIFEEYKARQKQMPELGIEDSIMLYYPYANYFFVNKQNKELAKRLEIGLRQMIDDGSFQIAFDQFYQETVMKARLANRKVIKLVNPFLPPKTPVNDPVLWYHP